MTCDFEFACQEESISCDSWQVRLESLSLLDPQFSASNGTLRNALLSHTCRKKIKEMTNGTAIEKQAHWSKLTEGKDVLAIDIAMYDAKIIRLAGGASMPSGHSGSKHLGDTGDFGGCDIQLDGEAHGGDCALTVADIKKQLHEKHNITCTDAACDYALCYLLDDRVGPKLDDDNALVERGSSLIVYPANAKKLLQLPSVLIHLPAESIEIDGHQKIPVNVKSLTCNKDHFTEIQLPLSCTALQLKQQLASMGYAWALDQSKVMSFSNKPIKNECVIPASCDLPLKVVQTVATSTSSACILAPLAIFSIRMIRAHCFCQRQLQERRRRRRTRVNAQSDLRRRASCGIKADKQRALPDFDIASITITKLLISNQR